MSESDLEKKKTRNVFVLGAAFGLIFTGFLTITATAETILRSYQRRTGTDDLNAFLRIKCENQLILNKKDFITFDQIREVLRTSTTK